MGVFLKSVDYSLVSNRDISTNKQPVTSKYSEVNRYSDNSVVCNTKLSTSIMNGNFIDGVKFRVSLSGSRLKVFKESFEVVVEIVKKLNDHSLKLSLSDVELGKYNGAIENQINFIKQLLDNLQLVDRKVVGDMRLVIQAIKGDKVMSDIDKIKSDFKRDEFVIHLYRVVLLDIKNFIDSGNCGNEVDKKVNSNSKKNNKLTSSL